MSARGRLRPSHDQRDGSRLQHVLSSLAALGCYACPEPLQNESELQQVRTKLYDFTREDEQKGSVYNLVEDILQLEDLEVFKVFRSQFVEVMKFAENMIENKDMNKSLDELVISANSCILKIRNDEIITFYLEVKKTISKFLFATSSKPPVTYNQFVQLVDDKYRLMTVPRKT